MKRLYFFVLLLAIANVAGTTAFAQKFTKPPITDSDWIKPYPPFRIAGNLYYVGSRDLACYLITTPQGNILINTGMYDSAPMLKKNIETLGFKFADTKILLIAHAHYDHAGGAAGVKRMTHAKVEINENDAAALANGDKDDYGFDIKDAKFEGVKADVLLHGYDTVKFGGMKIAVIPMYGHTKGACGFMFDVKDSKRTYRVLMANMPSVLDATNLHGMPTYPNVGKDYAATFKIMKNLHFDIWLASHAGQFDLDKKHKPGAAYNPMAFADRAGYDQEVAELYAAYQKRLNQKQPPSKVK